MPHTFLPTSKNNATSRLFFRFLALYLLVAPIAFLANSDSLTAWMRAYDAGKIECSFVLIALALAFSTLSKPLLFFCTVLKSFFDMTLFHGALTAAFRREIGVLSLNALLLYLAASLFLFAYAAARASLFPHLCPERDTALLFSRAFLGFLAEAMVHFALATLLFFFWRTLSRLI